MPRHSIIIADDHPFTLLGTRAFVEGLGYAVLDVCGNGISAYNSILARAPDMALLDMSMPGMNGIEILEALHKKKLRTRIVLLTMHNELSIFNRARDLGVAGFVLKELATEELENCLASVARGGTCFSASLTAHLQHDAAQDGSDAMKKLSASERKILELVAKQHTSKVIAQMLFISDKTVENHRSAIMKKLDIPPEKNALLIWAMKNLEGAQ